MNKFILILSLFLVGCHTLPESKKQVVFVSIAPLKYVVEQILDTAAFRVEVLVPETASPESYEPTVQQIRRLADAQACISVGLIDFEQVLAGKIEAIAPNTAQLNLAASDPVDGWGQSEPLRQQHGHHHAYDPHIWLSPQRVGRMGREIAAFLGELHPDSASVYQARAGHFAERIDTLDRYIRQAVSGAGRKGFAIGHPSLGYFADDYGLQQIVIEEEGKEPSVQRMKQLSDSLRRQGIRTILYQRQTSDAAARTIARELTGGRTTVFDPLAENWAENLHRLADTLQVILNE